MEKQLSIYLLQRSERKDNEHYRISEYQKTRKVQAIKKTGKRIKGVSQLIGNDSKARKQSKHAPLGHRRVRNGANDATSRNLVPFALKPVESEHLYLDVESYFGEENEFGSIEIQLKLIEDLYPVISSLDEYKELELTPELTPAKVLCSLLNQIYLLSKFEKWEIIKPNDTYLITGLNCLDAEPACFIAIDFLAKINQSHERLHTFLIYAFRLVSQYNNIELLYEFTNGMYYEHLQERLEWDAKEYDESVSDGEQDDFHYSVKHSMEYYGSKGMVGTYNRLLSGGASLRMFKKQLSEFVPQNKLEEVAIPFLKATLELAETKMNILDYCQEPWESGEVTPRNYFRVMWSWDDDDNMFQIFKDELDSMANGCGAVGFCWNVTLEKGKDVSLKKDYDFINKVGKFFELGNEMSNAINSEVKNWSENIPKPLK